MSWAVEARNLTKQFGNVRALDDITFQINQGEIYGLIGPNGAGKITTLRIISTLILPTSGAIRVFNQDPVTQAIEGPKIISHLPEEAGAHRNPSGSESLSFMAKFNTKNPAQMENLTDEATKISGLGDPLKNKVKTFGKGMKRRLPAHK